MQNGKDFLCLIQETTTRTCNFSCKKLFIYIIIFSLSIQSVFTQDEKEWTVAAEKFTFIKGQKNNSVTEGISETIPKNILEGLNQTLNRNIKPDESLDRKRSELRKKRQSLYLQLSSEYQKRDNLFLNYNGRKLEKKIKEQEEKIADIKNQIDNNIEELKIAEKEEELVIEEYVNDNHPATEKEKMATFFKSIISNDKAVVKSEKIKLYNNDSSSLILPSQEAKIRGYNSTYFSEEMESKGINSLITGEISNYGGYMSIAVDLYLYPGGRKIGSVMEIGSGDEIEFITSSIVRQLIPLLTNSMPVNVIFSLNPQVPLKDVQIYIDDILQKTSDYNLIISSGVHSFQIVAKGYKSLSTNYFFEGNTKYNIVINLEEKKEGNINIQLANPLLGTIYTNGIMAEKVDYLNSKIIINGQQVLGEFISEDGNTAFFYIPEKLYYDGNNVKINPKPIDRGKNIDKRRRWMYGSYSAFMVSLIPTFITKGILDNKVKLYNDRNIDYDTAKNWQITYNVFAGISIGLAVFWGVELVRYLISANSVLPEKAKQGDAVNYNAVTELNNKIELAVPEVEENKADVSTIINNEIENNKLEKSPIIE